MRQRVFTFDFKTSTFNLSAQSTAAPCAHCLSCLKERLSASFLIHKFTMTTYLLSNLFKHDTASVGKPLAFEVVVLQGRRQVWKVRCLQLLQADLEREAVLGAMNHCRSDRA